MSDDPPPVLQYAPPAGDGREEPSRYAVAAVATLCADFIWFFLPGPFDEQKHFSIFITAWWLGLMLVLAAYVRRHGSRALRLAAVVLLIVDFFLTLLVPSY